MADTVREIERKYEADSTTRLPDLAGIDRVATVVEQGVEDLDALYYDTPDQRLTAAGITLRRRTGGRDAGWHLKLPARPGEREEIRALLSDVPPPELTSLVRARVLDRDLVPVVRLRTRRTVRELRDAAGAPLAEVAVDEVWAWPAGEAEKPGAAGVAGRTEARWREIEVELTGGGERAPGLLDEVERALAAVGVHPAAAPSKLARALEETGLRSARPEDRTAAVASGKGGAAPAGRTLARKSRARRDPAGKAPARRAPPGISSWSTSASSCG